MTTSTRALETFAQKLSSPLDWGCQYLGFAKSEDLHVTYPVRKSELFMDELLLESAFEIPNLAFSSAVTLDYEGQTAKTRKGSISVRPLLNEKTIILKGEEALKWLKGERVVTLTHSFLFREKPTLRFTGFRWGGLLTGFSGSKENPKVVDLAACFFQEPWGPSNSEVHQSLSELDFHGRSKRSHTVTTSYYKMPNSHKVCIEPFSIICPSLGDDKNS